MKLPAKVNEFIRLALECEAALDWDKISSIYGIQQNRVFFHNLEKCHHAAEGNHKIIDAFVEAIKGPKTLGAKVVRIERVKKADGSTECVVFYKKDNVIQSVRSGKVAVTVPFHMLHSIQMSPTLSDEQWKAIDAITPGYYTVVHFILGVDAVKSLLVDGKNPFPVLTRGSLGVVYGFRGIPKEPQKEFMFSLLIHGEYSRTYLQSQDRRRTEILAEMDKIWPGFSKFVHASYFYNYHPAAVPGWPPGHSPLDSLHASLRQENVGLYLGGDYIFTSHAEGAVESGRDLAKKITADLKVTADQKK